MSDLVDLKPNLLWKWFEKICSIPHPSCHEDVLANFIVNWAHEHGFFSERDEVGNVLIRKPATKGYEKRKGIILQAHLDMVPQSNNDVEHNFLKDAIKPYIDGDWVRAKGTTLGADNGMGMASCLAILESKNLEHPDLEVLLTMTEETGMDGAFGLKPNWLKGEWLINTDTEQDGEIYIGCAGGVDAQISLPLVLENNSYSCHYEIVIKGLKGGHSGADIHKGRANAIKLAGRILDKIDEEIDFSLTQFQSGTVRNAIPRETIMGISFHHQYFPFFQEVIRKQEQIFKKEFFVTDPNLHIRIHEIKGSEFVLNNKSSHNFIKLINALPNGVIKNSSSLNEVVESSLNLSVVEIKKNHVEFYVLIRSLIESGKKSVMLQLKSVCDLINAQVNFSGDYPGWNPEPQSNLLTLAQKVYRDVLKIEPKTKVIHAGLECGLLKKAYPNVEMISFGPTIIDAHSPDEKVHIPSVLRYWNVLMALLKNVP